MVVRDVRRAAANGSMIGMTQPRAKIAITIDPEVLARVRLAVEAGRARSVSGYVERAVVGQLAAETDFDAILAEIFEATGGQPTDEERAAARRLLAGEAA